MRRSGRRSRDFRSWLGGNQILGALGTRGNSLVLVEVAKVVVKPDPRPRREQSPGNAEATFPVQVVHKSLHLLLAAVALSTVLDHLELGGSHVGLSLRIRPQTSSSIPELLELLGGAFAWAARDGGLLESRNI